MAQRQPSHYRTLASLSRINLLHELQQHGSQTIGKLAKATGLHHNTAREHLHRLIDAGFVSSEPIPATAKGRPTILYSAGSAQSGEQRTNLARKPLPLREVNGKMAAQREQLGVLDSHMLRCGFDAITEVGSQQVVTHDCPFAELARKNPQVCQVHFELAKDILQQVDGPVRARSLRPFFTESDCVLDLDLGTDQTGASES